MTEILRIKDIDQQDYSVITKIKEIEDNILSELRSKLNIQFNVNEIKQNIIFELKSYIRDFIKEEIAKINLKDEIIKVIDKEIYHKIQLRIYEEVKAQLTPKP